MTDDIARVRRLAMELPGVEEKTSYGTPAFYVRGKLFARIHELPGVLVLRRPSVLDREELVAAEPTKFFITEHYVGYAMVLARVAEVDDAELRELLIESWILRAPKRLRDEFVPDAEAD